MGAVVAHGPVAAVGVGERVFVEVGAGEPGEELADLGGVGAPRLLRQRRGAQSRGVAIEDPDRAPTERSLRGRVAARQVPSCSLQWLGLPGAVCRAQVIWQWPRRSGGRTHQAADAYRAARETPRR